ncbi:hypothetical protein [Metallosphaera yellowstonensis]|uniref:hypothetical protein n=1 Tax=Metallosphaera yellowstonensis TaxID=1111107 RepID=UPI0012DC2ADD|nr:hypothetical protein [Metallosphaera yellowstonensis]
MKSTQNLIIAVLHQPNFTVGELWESFEPNGIGLMSLPLLLLGRAHTCAGLHVLSAKSL